MAQKDILEKILMAHGDVFADCVNVFLYGGQPKLRGGDLCPAPTESFYQGKAGKRSQFCDRSFFQMEDGQVKAQYFIENETRLKRRQALRKASYQGGSYREQLELKQPVYPVIGIILNWTGRRSRIPSSLRRLLASEGADMEALRFVDDVTLKLYHMRNLSKEVRDRFTSDMGFVVDYLNTGSFEGRGQQRIAHGEALCEMMEALTGDARFTDMIGNLLEKQEEGEGIVMCEYIDMLEAKGEARGKEIGKEIGEGRLASLLSKLYALGRDEDAKLAVNDRAARGRLYEELGIAGG